MTVLYVNADWSALVPAGSVEARYGISPAEATRRGLLPEVKQSPKASDKAIHRAPNKGAKPDR